MKTIIRINKENSSFETIASCKKEWDEILFLCQKYDWTYDIIGRRPW